VYFLCGYSFWRNTTTY